MVTAYLSTDISSNETYERAKDLASILNTSHLSIPIDSLINPFLTLFELVTGKFPKFSNDGGSRVENIARQNLQARIRMVFSYLLAQLLPWCLLHRQGFLLVLGTTNVDES